MIYVRITISETNGLDETVQTHHVELPTRSGSLIETPRGVAIALQDRAHATEELKRLVQTIALAMPATQTIKIEFHVP